jgi:hypothetical protein
MRTALRFLPIPVTVDGRSIERGFPGGRFRMRISDPLPAELAVTDEGDNASLWLLEHGVLSTTAVVPGHPAISAAVELSSVADRGVSSAELRRAVTPHLSRLIDEGVRMLVLLAERLPDVDEDLRQRMTVLLLHSAACGLRSDQVRELPIVRIGTGSDVRFVSLNELARTMDEGSAVLKAVDPHVFGRRGVVDSIIVASPEERNLLAEVLAVPVEGWTGGKGRCDLGLRIMAAWRNVKRVLLGHAAAGPYPEHELSRDERRLISVAADGGVDLRICRFSGAARRRGSVWLVSREQKEVQNAVRAVASGEEWLYPSLLAVLDDGSVIRDDIRRRWVAAVGAEI